MTPAIVFDLDGTLIDSLPDIVASFRWAFGELGLDAPDEAAVREQVGAPLEAMYAAFADARHVPELVSGYRRHYPRHFTERTRPHPGVVEILRALRARGHPLAVATTKSTSMARDLVGALGLDAELDWVQGTDAFPHKPAPDVILRALAALGAPGAWMVGDTRTDVLAGKAAGLATYAVTWGTDGAEALGSVEPDVLEPNLARLLELV